MKVATMKLDHTIEYDTCRTCGCEFHVIKITQDLRTGEKKFTNIAPMYCIDCASYMGDK